MLQHLLIVFVCSSLLTYSFFVLFLQNSVSLCNHPGCSGTQFVDHNVLELKRYLPASTNPELGAKVCTTPPDQFLTLIKNNQLLQSLLHSSLGSLQAPRLRNNEPYCRVAWYWCVFTMQFTLSNSILSAPYLKSSVYHISTSQIY